MFGWFKKGNSPVKCFACGGVSTHADIIAYYDFCNELHILQGLSKGFMKASPIAVRKALGIPKEHSMGSAIDEPILSSKNCLCSYCLFGNVVPDENTVVITHAGYKFDSEKHRETQKYIKANTTNKGNSSSDTPNRCVECHHILPLHSAACSKPAPLSPEEVRTTSSTGGQKGVKAERHSLIPKPALDALARCMAKGAVKYSDHNWRKGYEFSKSLDSALRHLLSYIDGEDNDPEIGESHLAAVMFHCSVLITLMETHPEFDDRYKEPSKETKTMFEKNMEALKNYQSVRES